ncbi:hypothetical protein FIBSPDRAFT_696207, partial [Athelia psychrophila]
ISAQEEEDTHSLDSDALDEPDEEEEPSKSRKRKRALPTKKAQPKKSSPRKKRKSDEVDDSDEEYDLKEGQEIVGTVVEAPKTGRVPPGQVSHNTLNFLAKLKDPKCNDREWYVTGIFHLFEPVYRLAEKEWKDFVEEFTNIIVDEVDSQIPHLPPKDVIHRIYRDVRFSNDKTPYKQNFSASFSRSGRKGIFSHFQPGDRSILAAGLWCPGKNELETLRSHLLRACSAESFRELIAEPEFVAHFGDPTVKPKKKDKKEVDVGERRTSIFGRDDELKVAPKGIDKNHPDIDLLKCRSFAVVHQFTDEQVAAADFKQELARVAKVAQPFVRRLNDMISLPVGDAEDEED